MKFMGFSLTRRDFSFLIFGHVLAWETYGQHCFLVLVDSAFWLLVFILGGLFYFVRVRKPAGP